MRPTVSRKGAKAAKTMRNVGGRLAVPGRVTRPTRVGQLDPYTT